MSVQLVQMIMPLVAQPASWLSVSNEASVYIITPRRSWQSKSSLPPSNRQLAPLSPIPCLVTRNLQSPGQIRPHDRNVIREARNCLEKLSKQNKHPVPFDQEPY